MLLTKILRRARFVTLLILVRTVISFACADGRQDVVNAAVAIGGTTQTTLQRTLNYQKGKIVWKPLKAHTRSVGKAEVVDR